MPESAAEPGAASAGSASIRAKTVAVSRRAHAAAKKTRLSPEARIVVCSRQEMGDLIMPKGVDVSDSQTAHAADSKYTAAHKTRHRSATTARRLVFFTLASVWGFAVGVTGLLAAMNAAGAPVRPSPRAIAGLIPALIVAVAGAFVMVAAYKESRRHSR